MTNFKKTYSKPEIELILAASGDILVLSTGSEEDYTTDNNWSDWYN